MQSHSKCRWTCLEVDYERRGHILTFRIVVTIVQRRILSVSCMWDSAAAACPPAILSRYDDRNSGPNRVNGNGVRINRGPIFLYSLGGALGESCSSAFIAGPLYRRVPLATFIPANVRPPRLNRCEKSLSVRRTEGRGPRCPGLPNLTT